MPPPLRPKGHRENLTKKLQTSDKVSSFKILVPSINDQRKTTFYEGLPEGQAILTLFRK